MVWTEAALFCRKSDVTCFVSKWSQAKSYVIFLQKRTNILVATIFVRTNFLNQVPNNCFFISDFGLEPYYNNLGSGVPSKIAADKPHSLLQLPYFRPFVFRIISKKSVVMLHFGLIGKDMCHIRSKWPLTENFHVGQSSWFSRWLRKIIGFALCLG